MRVMVERTSYTPQGHIFAKNKTSVGMMPSVFDLSAMLDTVAWRIVCQATHAKHEYCPHCPLSSVLCPLSPPSRLANVGLHCKPAVYSRLRPSSTADGFRRRRGVFFCAERGCVGPQQEGLAGQEPIHRSKVRWNQCRSACWPLGCSRGWIGVAVMEPLKQ